MPRGSTWGFLLLGVCISLHSRSPGWTSARGCWAPGACRQLGPPTRAPPRTWPSGWLGPCGPHGQGLVWLSRGMRSSHPWLRLCCPGVQVRMPWFGDGLMPQWVPMGLAVSREVLEGNLGWLTGASLFSLQSLSCLAGAGTSAWGGRGTGRWLVPPGGQGLVLGLQHPCRWHTSWGTLSNREPLIYN